MRNLVLLFVKFGGIILFLILEAFCMYLVVQNNKRQKDIFFSSANVASGNLYYSFDKVARFWSLSSVADSLAKENAQLRAQLNNAKFIETIREDSIKDEDINQKYTFIEATIINNSVTQHNNNITLDRGKKHGIEQRMGVIGQDGIVGIVRSTSNSFSQVMSILHKQTKISSSIKRNNFFGSLIWKENNPKITHLNDIPKHASLKIGDTIQTSGYSSIFPEGIMIGIIDTFWIPRGSNFYNIEVELKNDLSSTKYVYVIKNLMKDEQEDLEEEVKDE